MIDDNPLVSIIVPVYNTEKYLNNCIDSLLNQAYSNIEIILIDDGSSDNSPAICDSFSGNSRIKVIHQLNQGVSAARNRGIEEANGDYLMFVDSDDSLTSNAVELLVTDAKKFSADVVSAVKMSVDEKGRTKSLYDDGKIAVYSNLEPLKLSLNYDRQTSVVQAKLFRRDFVKDLRFAEGRKVNEDGYYIFQCYSLQPKLVQHNVAIYIYQIQSNSSSKNGPIEKYYDILFFGNEKERFIRDCYPELIPYATNMQVSTNIFFLYVLCRTHDRKYLADQKTSVNFIRENCKNYRTDNKFEKKMVLIVRLRLFRVYKWAVLLRNRLRNKC